MKDTAYNSKTDALKKDVKKIEAQLLKLRKQSRKLMKVVKQHQNDGATRTGWRSDINLSKLDNLYFAMSRVESLLRVSR